MPHDAHGHPLRKDDKVRILARTPLTRRGDEQVGYVVLDGHLDVDGVLVSSRRGGSPRVGRGWCGWVVGKELERVTT